MYSCVSLYACSLLRAKSSSNLDVGVSGVGEVHEWMRMFLLSGRMCRGRNHHLVSTIWWRWLTEGLAPLIVVVLLHGHDRLVYLGLWPLLIRDQGCGDHELQGGGCGVASCASS
jgi:hypothetical protein